MSSKSPEKKIGILQKQIFNGILEKILGMIPGKISKKPVSFLHKCFGKNPKRISKERPGKYQLEISEGLGKSLQKSMKEA